MSDGRVSHFLFISGALRERTSLASAELQLAHELWGLRTALIRDNLGAYLTDHSCGLVYVLKLGICAGFKIVSGVLPPHSLDEFTRDELRAETRYGLVRIKPLQTWKTTAEESLTLLHQVLAVPDQTELARRLNLGMHRLTQEQYEALVKALARIIHSPYAAELLNGRQAPQQTQRSELLRYGRSAKCPWDTQSYGYGLCPKDI